MGRSYTQVSTYHCDRCQQPIPPGEEQRGEFGVIGVDGVMWELTIGENCPYEPMSAVDLCRPCMTVLELALTRAWRKGVRKPKP